MITFAGIETRCDGKLSYTSYDGSAERVQEIAFTSSLLKDRLIFFINITLAGLLFQPDAADGKSITEFLKKMQLKKTKKQNYKKGRIEMKSYKEMSEMMEKKIEAAMENPNARPFYICGLIDSWLAFAERDRETPEEEMRAKYEKVLAFIEKKLEEAEPHKESGDRSLNLTFSYVAVRQKLEPPKGGEEEAQMIHIMP